MVQIPPLSGHRGCAPCLRAPSPKSYAQSRCMRTVCRSALNKSSAQPDEGGLAPDHVARSPAPCSKSRSAIQPVSSRDAYETLSVRAAKAPHPRADPRRRRVRTTSAASHHRCETCRTNSSGMLQGGRRKAEGGRRKAHTERMRGLPGSDAREVRKPNSASSGAREALRPTWRANSHRS